MNIKLQTNETDAAEAAIEKVTHPPSHPPSFYTHPNRLSLFYHPITHPPTYPPTDSSSSFQPPCSPPPNPPTHPPTYSIQAKKAAPRNADVIGAYAEFLLMQGKVDEAAKELEKSIRLDPTNPLPFINKVKKTLPPTHPPIHVVSFLSFHPSTHSPLAHSSSFQPPPSLLPNPPTHPPTHPPTQALIAWQGQDIATARETLQHVIDMDPQYQPAYSFLANLVRPTHPPTHPPTHQFTYLSSHRPTHPTHLNQPNQTHPPRPINSPTHPPTQQEFKGASTMEDSQPAFDTIDKGK